VPCFILGGRIAVQGAQAPEYLAQAITRAANQQVEQRAAG
jgi:predicted DsbA family dithiol-disulfide isomerase